MGTITAIIDTLKRILLELAEYFDNESLMVAVTGGVIALTFITFLLFKKIRIVKYIPGFIVLSLGLYNFYSVLHVLTAESSVPILLLAVIGVVAGLAGMLFALIIGIVAKPVKRKRKKATKSTDESSEKPKDTSHESKV